MLLEVGDLRFPKDGENVSIIDYIFLKIEDNLLCATNRVTDRIMTKCRLFSRGSRQKIYNEVRQIMLSDLAARLDKCYGIAVTDGYTSGRQKLRLAILDFNKLDTLYDIANLNIGQDFEDFTYDSIVNRDLNKAKKMKMEAVDGVASVRLDDMGLSVRAVNALQAAGLYTGQDLANLGMRRLVRVRGLGLKSITEIVIRMKDFGLDLTAIPV